MHRVLLIVLTVLIIWPPASAQTEPVYDVIEDFSSEPVNFSDDPFFSVSNGRLFFHGDRSDGVAGVIWVGGSNPGGENPLPENSNYFENFKVSVDTYWEGGADNYAYGLAICTQEKSIAVFVG